MKILIKSIRTAIILCLLLVSCKSENRDGFILKGEIANLKEGTLVLYVPGIKEKLETTLNKGKFEFTGKVKHPVYASLRLKNDYKKSASFYIENKKLIFKGDINNFENFEFKGSPVQDYNKRYLTESGKIFDRNKELYKQLTTSGISKEKKDSIKNRIKIVTEEIDKDILALRYRFIKEKPNDYYSAMIVSYMVHGMSAADKDKLIKSLSPTLQKNHIIKKISASTKNELKYEVSIDQLMKNVSDVTYKVDKSFKGIKFSSVNYLASINKTNVCALKRGRHVVIISPNGKELNKFKLTSRAGASSLATDKDDNIYVFTSLRKMVKKKVRGKIAKKNINLGVKCEIFSDKGKLKNTFTLKGISKASGAKVADGKIILSDCGYRKVAFYDKTNGKLVSEIKNMRSCCGILDICVNNKNEVLVANLGAFRVQSYDINGNNKLTFGKKGKTMDDFLGCCNPVSVGSLNNGAIITVEKDPTRIKVYSKEGAKKIIGIDELVEGCSYIPMAIDNNDNIYLASAKKGIVKCIAITNKQLAVNNK